MTGFQRTVLILTAAVIIGMLLFPPFLIEGGFDGSVDAGYHFILNPNAPNEPYSAVNTFLLLAQIIGVGLAGGLVYWSGKKGD